MASIRFKRGRAYAADMAVYARQIAETNTTEIDQLKRNLLRAVREELTPRQQEMLYLYYCQKVNMPSISKKMGVSVSTVSRTIKRAEGRLQRCLRYGAKAYLNSLDQEKTLP